MSNPRAAQELFPDRQGRTEMEALSYRLKARRRTRFANPWLWLSRFIVPAFVLFWFFNPAAALKAQPARSTDYDWQATTNSMYEFSSWIWDRRTEDFQTCRFWKKFELPSSASVRNAHLRITADNGYRLFLDGREIGQAGEWQRIIDYDVTSVLGRGTHVLAVEAFNGTLYAGVILQLTAELSDGKVFNLGTDASWKVIPTDESGWQQRISPSANWRPATIVHLARWRPLMTHGPVIQPVKVRFWETGAFQIALLTFCSVVGLLCLYLMTQLAAQRKSQRLLALERSRLARDLHDDLGAALTQIILSAEVAQRELPVGTLTRSRLEQLCSRMRELSGTINDIVWVVNPQRDTPAEFSSYICKYAETFLRTASIRCRFDVSAEFPGCDFEMPVRRNLFLAVKEALNNAAKNSGATEVLLRIHCEGQEIHVTVQDNGKGFDPMSASGDRNGLRNMRHRMEQLDAKCAIKSEAGKGSRVEFIMPLTKTRIRQPLDLSRSSSLEFAAGKVPNDADEGSLGQTFPV